MANKKFSAGIVRLLLRRNYEVYWKPYFPDSVIDFVFRISSVQHVAPPLLTLLLFPLQFPDVLHLEIISQTVPTLMCTFQVASLLFNTEKVPVTFVLLEFSNNCKEHYLIIKPYQNVPFILFCLQGMRVANMEYSKYQKTNRYLDVWYALYVLLRGNSYFKIFI